MAGLSKFEQVTPVINSAAYTLKLNAAHRLGAAKTFLDVEDFEPGEATFAVVVSRDSFAEVLRGHCRFAKCDAQRVHFRVVADLHGRLKNSRLRHRPAFRAVLGSGDRVGGRFRSIGR